MSFFLFNVVMPYCIWLQILKLLNFLYEELFLS